MMIERKGNEIAILPKDQALARKYPSSMEKSTRMLILQIVSNNIFITLRLHSNRLAKSH